MELTEKTCFKCGETKPIGSFYRHPKMADGHLGKCKECTKSDVNKNRADKIDYYREFDRSRGMLEHRVAARAKYQKTEAGKAAVLRAHRAQRVRAPHKFAARAALGNAVRDGRVIRPEGCWRCGTECVPHGHHADYNNALGVTWLCSPCHTEAHKLTKRLQAA